MLLIEFRRTQVRARQQGWKPGVRGGAGSLEKWQLAFTPKQNAPTIRGRPPDIICYAHVHHHDHDHPLFKTRSQRCLFSSTYIAVSISGQLALPNIGQLMYGPACRASGWGTAEASAVLGRSRNSQRGPKAPIQPSQAGSSRDRQAHFNEILSPILPTRFKKSLGESSGGLPGLAKAVAVLEGCWFFLNDIDRRRKVRQRLWKRGSAGQPSLCGEGVCGSCFFWCVQDLPRGEGAGGGGARRARGRARGRGGGRELL